MVCSLIGKGDIQHIEYDGIIGVIINIVMILYKRILILSPTHNCATLYIIIARHIFSM